MHSGRDRLRRVTTILPAFLARSLKARYVSLRRDVAMVGRTLVGQHPSPLVSRATARPTLAHAEAETPRLAPAVAALSPRRLRVARVTRETEDAVTIHLEDPRGLPFVFVPGQFFTLLLRVDGEDVRRAYSASSAPGATSLALTVKRVPGGRVSSYLNDQARDAMVIDVLGPSGSFVVPDRATASRSLVLIAGGSGITPVFSIAHAELAKGERGVVLVYGNRRERDIIFRRELDELARMHTARFALRHVLSEPSAGWAGGIGQLDSAACARELDALGVDAGADYFVCGPDAMMSAARHALDARGVARDRIHEERFGSPPPRGSQVAAASEARVVILRAGVPERSVVVAPGQTLLEAGLEAGEAMPFSCAMGGCGACKVKLVAGEVSMDEPSCLSDQERAAGYVLACVGRPKGDVTVAIS